MWYMQTILSEFSDENMEFIFEGKDGTILTKVLKIFYHMLLTVNGETYDI